MNPFEIDLAGGSMAEQRKAKKRKARRKSDERVAYVTIRGKRIKTTVRGARIHRLVTKALKGVEVPPP